MDILCGLVGTAEVQYNSILDKLILKQKKIFISVDAISARC
ncbi:hypothetical protein HPL003_18825 [Paenibacillus terrae HPL-003]|uniref:Uncharacterized protein n=1 Tax=Paenibacillus terrae (strain HPL-003) TaxID=985665 RepID=G7W4V7_PAETH|nr:hypothetical protein HPL003_18825 [Paenibacillus terrae HPL-003]